VLIGSSGSLGPPFVGIPKFPIYLSHVLQKLGDERIWATVEISWNLFPGLSVSHYSCSKIQVYRIFGLLMRHVNGG